MKHLFLYCTLLTLLTACSKSQFSDPEPKVSILGSVHFPTQNLNADSIYQVLLDFQPDFILTEIDPDRMYEDYTYKNLYNENEIISIVRYKINHPDVALRPIDIFQRNNKRKERGIFSEASAVFRNLNGLDNEKGFSKEEQLVWDKFSEYWALVTEIGEGPLATINTRESDRLVDSLINYQYYQLRKIVDNNPTFKAQILSAKNDSVSLKQYFHTWADFEMERNQAIADNVLKYLKENPRKRIIISLGYKHRFFVKKYLEEQGIKPTEFYD